MGSSIVAIVLGAGGLLLIGYAFYKSLVKKKRLANMYTPYDDMTRGTNDTNHLMHLEEDTRHQIPVEETKSVE